MKNSLNLLIVLFGIAAFAAPGYAEVDYVKCNAMNQAIATLADTPELSALWTSSKIKALNAGYSGPMLDAYTGIYYREAIAELQAGKGSGSDVAVVKKLTAINNARTKMGCP